MLRAEAGRRVRVFTNATVLPVDAAFGEAEALAIRGNRIVAVGAKDAVLAAAGSRAEQLDLEGAVVLPGFIEPHMHFALLAGIGHWPDIGPFQYATVAEALEALKRIAREKAEGQWIEARQFDPSLQSGPAELTTRELDAVSATSPVFVWNASGHLGYANSVALKLAGVGRDSPNPPGAEYGRYADGRPNGVLKGPPAILSVVSKNEDLMVRTSKGFAEAGLRVCAEAAALGVTTLCDQGTGALNAAADLEHYRKMAESGRMQARIRASLMSLQAAAWDEAGIRPGQGDALVRVVAWKIVSDGSNQGFTGRQREPYLGTENRGLFYVQPDDLKQQVRRRLSQGWQVAVHGNGDAAIDAILDAVESARDAGIDVAERRVRIEHCSILHDDQIARMKALSVSPSFLMNHVYYWGQAMRDEVFGPEKVRLLDRAGAVERAGIPWTMHSDAPVSPLGPLRLIETAVVRDLWREPETVLAPAERVSVEAAIRSLTRNAARQCHSEHEIGSLEPGKLADFVVLAEDPRDIDPKRISEIEIRETWMDGRRVHPT